MFYIKVFWYLWNRIVLLDHMYQDEMDHYYIKCLVLLISHFSIIYLNFSMFLLSFYNFFFYHTITIFIFELASFSMVIIWQIIWRINVNFRDPFLAHFLFAWWVSVTNLLYVVWLSVLILIFFILISNCPCYVCCSLSIIQYKQQ